MPIRPKVLLAITDAGGGHRASAVALEAAFRLHAPRIESRIVNMYHGPWKRAEPMGALTGFYGEDFYNLVLKRSWLGLAGAMRRGARLAASLPNRAAIRDGVAWLREEKPDLVLSLMPFVNDLHARICAEAGVPFALVMTDLVDTRPFMWYTPLACRRAEWVSAPCETAAAQAREAGAARVLESGLLLHPKYMEAGLRSLDRRAARARLGLEAEPFTVLLTMGGFAGKTLRQLVDGLEKAGQGWQIVAVCGRNEALRQERAARPAGRNRLAAVGFTDQLPWYLRAADVMVGKPGPASVFEAVSAGTPMVLDAQVTMPQELPNAGLTALHGMGLKASRRSQIPGLVAELAAVPAARACLEAAQAAYPLRDAGKALAEAVLESVEGGRAAAA